MKIATLTVVLILAGSAAYVRFAPSNANQWNAALPATDPLTNCSQITTLKGGATLSCTAPEGALTKLDIIATSSPRTHRLAGSPEAGCITWITRSRLWGFPDYTPAQVTQPPPGPRLDIHARLRFGRSDMGVNAARLHAWLAQL